MENKRKTYIILGIFVIIVPLLGLPNSIKTIILVLLGLLIILGTFFIGRNIFKTSTDVKRETNKEDRREEEDNKKEVVKEIETNQIELQEDDSAGEASASSGTSSQ